MTNIRRALALLLIAALLTSLPALAAEEDIILPEPAAQPAQMILGDSCAQDTQEVTLYFVTEGSTNLTSAARAISITNGKLLAECAVRELLNSRFTAGVTSAASTDMQLIDFEFSCGVATVDLSIGSGQLSEQAELLRCAAIANTLLGIEGVEAVNILTGDRSDAVCSLPLGVITAQNESVAAYYAQLQSEQDGFYASPAQSIRRNVLIYYPSASGYFLPELRALEFSDEDSFIPTLLSAIQAEPERAAQCFSPVPGGNDLLAGDAYVLVSEAGERIAELNFSSMLPNYLAFSGVESWQLYGSIALSFCSFMPEVDGVRIRIEGEAVTELSMGERRLRFTDGIMRRADFSAAIGSSAALYFADGEGGLSRVECAMSQISASMPRNLLLTLVGAAAPEGLASAFPEEIYATDILGVRVDDRVATVNLSGSFYTHCQSLDEAQEHCLIYAMVNTLASLPGVGAVRFLVEGRTLDRLSQSIYLKSTLLPDPGMG